MKKSEFRGLGKVYRYTLQQQLKTKSFIISFIFILIVAVLIFPILSFFSAKKESDVYNHSIDTAYLINNTWISNDDLINDFLQKEDFKDLKIIVSDDDFDELCKKVSDNKKDEIIIDFDVNEETNIFEIQLFNGKSGNVKSEDVRILQKYIEEYVNEKKIQGLNISDEDLGRLNADITYAIDDEEDYIKLLKEEQSGNTNEGESDKQKLSISNAQYWVVYGGIMISFMIITYSSSIVANKIVEEKTNKVIEYLMTNVRPMAIVMGKIFASITAVIVLFSGTFLGVAISNVVSKKLFNYDGLKILSEMINKGNDSGISIVLGLVCVAFLVLGLIIYGTVSGLFGATVTKIEELQQGLRGYTIILLVGFYVSFVALGQLESSGVTSFVKFSMYFPLSAPLVMPGAIFIGNVSAKIILFSLALLGVFTVLVMWFVALIYENIIVSNGTMISFKTMVSMAKDRMRAGKAKGEQKNEK